MNPNYLKIRRLLYWYFPVCPALSYYWSDLYQTLSDDEQLYQRLLFRWFCLEIYKGDQDSRRMLSLENWETAERMRAYLFAESHADELRQFLVFAEKVINES